MVSKLENTKLKREKQQNVGWECRLQYVCNDKDLIRKALRCWGYIPRGRGFYSPALFGVFTFFREEIFAEKSESE